MHEMFDLLTFLCATCDPIKDLWSYGNQMSECTEVYRKCKRSRFKIQLNHLSWAWSLQTGLLHSLRKHRTSRSLSVALASPPPEPLLLLSDFLLPSDPVAYVWVSVAVWTGACPFGIAVSSCQADRVQNVMLPGNICRALSGALAHKYQEWGEKKKKKNTDHPKLLTHKLHCRYL